MRTLAVLTVAALLAGCAGTPVATRRAAESAHAPSSAAPSTAPSPAPSSSAASSPVAADEQPPEPVLLPTPCTDTDGVQVHHVDHEGMTGHWVVTVELRSARPCTLAGPTHVALLDGSGRPMAFRFAPGTWEPLHERPMAVDPQHGALVELSAYRCDVTPNPPVSRTAVLTLPAIAPLQVPARFSLCPKEPGSQPVRHSAIGSLDRGTAYAVAVGSDFAAFGDPTWAAGDVDGDDRPDTVVVRPRDGLLEVRLGTGRTVTARLGADGTQRIQGLAQLDGQGGDEILVGSTAGGAVGGYAYVDSGATAYTMVGGQLRRLAPVLTFDAGRGDLYAGVVCAGDTLTQVSTLYGGKPALTVRRVTWRLAGGTATKVSTTRDQETGDPLALTATHCPGLNADGWAAQ